MHTQYMRARSKYHKTAPKKVLVWRIICFNHTTTGNLQASALKLVHGTYYTQQTKTTKSHKQHATHPRADSQPRQPCQQSKSNWDGRESVNHYSVPRTIGTSETTHTADVPAPRILWTRGDPPVIAGCTCTWHRTDYIPQLAG